MSVCEYYKCTNRKFNVMDENKEVCLICNSLIETRNYTYLYDF